MEIGDRPLCLFRWPFNQLRGEQQTQRNIPTCNGGPPSLRTAFTSCLEKFDESTTYPLFLARAFTSIRQLFGCPLVDSKYLPDGTNCHSLGGVRVVRHRAGFIEDGYGKLRRQLRDTDNVFYRLPVTCDELRHVFSLDDEDAEPHYGVAEANERLCANPPGRDIIMRIGLARAWAGNDGTWSPRRCYAQLNGIICPEDNYHIFAGPPSS